MQQSAAGTTPTSVLPAQKVLTKRQKWQQKWQRRRKNRREGNVPQATKDSSEIKERDVGPVGKERKFRGVKRNAKSNMLLAKAVKRAKPDVVEIKTKTIRGSVFPKSEKKMMRKPRSVERRAYTDREEANFVKMVERYKSKLGKHMEL